MAAKKRILTACVRLFIERGYNGTTVAEIIKEADVSASSFQNIFRSKDGVLSELAAFMFAGQFKAARTVAGPDDSPAMIYAIETALQLTITELNDNLRDIYVEVYSHEATMEYIYRARRRSFIASSDLICPIIPRAIFTSWKSARPA